MSVKKRVSTMMSTICMIVLDVIRSSASHMGYTDHIPDT